MAEYIITKKSNLVAVADSIRERTGGTGKITLGEMIDDINHDIGGVELPTLTNEGSASDLLSGKQLIDGDGNKITGSFTIDSELATQDNLISQIQAAVDSLPEADSDTPTNVTLNFSWTATSSTYAPEVLYSYIDENGNYASNVYIAQGTTSGSTTLTVAKKSIICILARYIGVNQTGVDSYSSSDEIISLPNYHSYYKRYRNAFYLINNDGNLTVTINQSSVGGGGSN